MESRALLSPSWTADLRIRTEPQAIPEANLKIDNLDQYAHEPKRAKPFCLGPRSTGVPLFVILRIEGHR